MPTHGTTTTRILSRRESSVSVAAATWLNYMPETIISHLNSQCEQKIEYFMILLDVEYHQNHANTQDYDN